MLRAPHTRSHLVWGGIALREAKIAEDRGEGVAEFVGDAGGDLSDVRESLHLADARLELADRRQIGEERQQTEKRAVGRQPRDRRHADDQRRVASVVGRLVSRQRAALDDGLFEGGGELAVSQRVANGASGEFRVAIEPQNLASRRIDIDDASLGVGGDEPRGEASRESGGDALEIVGTALLQIVQTMELRLLTLHRLDGVSKRVDQIRFVADSRGAIPDRPGLIEQQLDRPGDARQVEEQ